MNDPHKTILEVFNAAPLEAIPKSNTKAYRLLLILADGTDHDRNKLIFDPLLGESMRSAIQDLRGDKLLNWLIHSGICEHSGARTIQLDPRHLSGNVEQDTAARRERRKEFKEVSAKEARQGRKREPRAVREMSLAQAEYFKSLGDAANEPIFKK